MTTLHQDTPLPGLPAAGARAEALLPRLLTRWLFREARVERNEPTAPGLHYIELSGPQLRGVPWAPGDKLQLRMGSGLQTRTYTPLFWDAGRGRTAILAHTRATGPGSEWVRQARPGQTVSVFGPRRSLDLSALHASQCVLVGDETAIGLAAAWQPGCTLLEVDHAQALRTASGDLGVHAMLVPRQDGDHPLARLAEAALAQGPDRRFVLVGRARTLQFLLRTLRRQGVPAGHIRTKAYWAEGKAGLD